MTPLPQTVCATSNAGEHVSLALSGDWRTDVAAAMEEEHGICEDASCDIREALEQGYPLTAAHLLLGATEAPVLEAVQRAYADAGLITDDESLIDFPSSEWEDWMAHHDRYGRRCEVCGSYTYANETFDPEYCANCGASLMHDYLFVCVIRERSNLAPEQAYEKFVEDGNPAFDDDTLFVSNAYAVTPEQVRDPDYGVRLFYGRDELTPEEAQS